MPLVHSFSKQMLFEDYGNPSAGYFLQIGGGIKRHKFESCEQRQSQYPRGVAARIRTVFPMRTLFVFLYPNDGQLMLEIEGKLFPLDEPTTKMTRTSRFYYLKTVTLQAAGVAPISFQYFHSDMIENGAENWHDFMLFVDNLLNGRAGRMRYFRKLSATANGVDISVPGFLAQIEREVDEELSGQKTG